MLKPKSRANEIRHNVGLGPMAFPAFEIANPGTITATGAGETGAGACHWSEPRKFTIAELKRITSLPDDFILTGKHGKKAERCGRMVPPLMMKAVAEAVYINVLEKYND